MTGIVAIFAGELNVLHLLLFPNRLQRQRFIWVLTAPAVFFAFTGAYVIRGFRLLVMYNPHMRNRWGYYINKEGATVQAALVAFATVEVVSWSAIALGKPKV